MFKQCDDDSGSTVSILLRTSHIEKTHIKSNLASTRLHPQGRWPRRGYVGRPRHITQDGEQLLDPLADHFSDRKTDRRSDDGIPERADLAVHFWSKRGPKETFWVKRRGSQGCHGPISPSVESAFGRTTDDRRTPDEHKN